MSILEESTRAALQPMMAVFNNLVMYRQDVAQNSIDSIVPDLATGWNWSEDGKELSFPLRQGVKWHDGKPFTAKDVKCTWDLLMGTGSDKLRVNPRKPWYSNVEAVTINGDYEVTFRLKQPQPWLLTLLASGWSPIYPCHVPAREIRQKPVGTGPFKFVEFKPNEYIRLAKNPDYWKPGRPYLDGIEFTILREIAPRNLAFFAGNFDVGSPYGVTPPTLKDFREQAPQAICEMTGVNVPRTMLINIHKPPFDNPELRRAMTLAIDREAFSTIINGGMRHVGATMMPPPNGVWGMPEDLLRNLPGYGADPAQNKAEARKIMEKLGYGPDKHLEVKVSTRNVATYRDPAVILIDQLKEVYVDGVLDTVETANWHTKVTRKDYAIALNATGSGVDDPDQQFYENYACGSSRNYSGYCNKEMDKLFDQQSAMSDQEKRKKLVWEIDQKLQEDGARPIIYHNIAATCMQPQVKGLTIMVNSIYNGWRFEDVWLDR
jgi:peptide/nickel transport system substrate-binding protein